MATVEESFPRGGTRKTHKSEKALRQPIEQDNLFDVSGVLVWLRLAEHFLSTVLMKNE